LRILLASCALALAGVVAGGVLADSFNFDDIEVQEEFGEAIVTLDAPNDAKVEHSNDASRGEFTVTFRGTSIRLPRRVYTGEGTLKSVDLEPWFSEGERLTRLVLRYEPGASAMFEREGDILFVALESPKAGSMPVMTAASTPSASAEATAASEPAAPASSATESATPAATAAAAPEPAMPQLAKTPEERQEAASESTKAEPMASAEAPAPAEPPVSPAPTDAAPVAADAAKTPWAAWSSDEAREEDARASAEGWSIADLWKNDGAQAPFGATAPPPPPARDAAPVASATTTEPASRSAETSGAEASVAEASAPPASAPLTTAPEAPQDPRVAEATKAEPAPATEISTAAAGQEDRFAARDVEPTRSDRTPIASASEPREVETPLAIPASAMAPRENARVRDTQPSVPQASDEGPNISIDLQGADIHTVLRSISESSGRNIVANSGVTGAVTLKLTNVPWRRALEIILRTQSLGYIEELGVIRVAPADLLRAEDIESETAGRKKDSLVALETSIIPVQFATAEEIKLSVGSVLSPRGKIDVDGRTNSIILTDIPSTIPVIRGLVKDLDSKTPQVEIVARLVDLDVSAARELGIKWGLNNVHSTAEAISGNASVDSRITNPAGTINFGIIRDFADLDVTLQALEQRQKANIISNPKISTVNNREARILVGQEIPLVVQDEAGNAITELKKIGIELRVTPYINQGDLITLDLHPEVSDLASQSSGSGGIIINTSEADTRVMVKDGETAVIGGMVRQNETEVVRGVPVLSQIPVVGGIFRSKSKSDAKRELVIFVTPRIVN